MHPTILAAALLAPLPQVTSHATLVDHVLGRAHPTQTPAAPAAMGSSCGVELAEILPADSTVGDRFGISVAVSGPTALVGADFADHGGLLNAEAAHVFERSGSTWMETGVLTTSDAIASAYSFFSALASRRSVNDPRRKR